MKAPSLEHWEEELEQVEKLGCPNRTRTEREGPTMGIPAVLSRSDASAQQPSWQNSRLLSSVFRKRNQAERGRNSDTRGSQED